jgi:putative ABC transport system permease protein
VRLQQVALGFDPRGLLTFNVARSADRNTTPQQIAGFYQQLTERLRALPGVVNASVVFQLPLSGSAATTGLTIEGHPTNPSDRPNGVIQMVDPEYFRTMGIPLVKGRAFTERDNLKSAPVLIINSTLARQHFPNEDPIGKRIGPGFSTVPMNDETFMREIVGVVADVKHQNLQGPPQPEIYFAQAQMPISAMTVVIRAAGEPRALQNTVRGVVQSLDHNAPVYSVRTVEEVVGRSVSAPRFNTLLLGLFAGVALILTAVGLYGVISYSVAQNTQQIGIRVALGAQTGDVIKLIVGQGARLTLAGVVIGLGAAYVLTRLMSNLLYGVAATDPWTFVGVAVLLMFVAFIACYLPARRATRIDPVVALRYE